MRETILDRYLASPKKVKADIGKLVAELLQENLFKETDDTESSGTDELLEMQDNLHYESPPLNAYCEIWGNFWRSIHPCPVYMDIVWKEPQDGAFP